MRHRLGSIQELEILARKAGYIVSIFAGYLGMSERQLERDFDEELNATPSAWIKDLQMNDAASHICNGIKISAVARMVGFKNATHFSRAFRRAKGSTPLAFFRDWIRKCRLREAAARERALDFRIVARELYSPSPSPRW
jgi:AraC-like DNA-binding protein